MTINMGSADRVIRGIVGVVLIALVLWARKLPGAGSGSFRWQPR